MNPSNDYRKYGGTPVEDNQPQQVDYSQYGGQVEKPPKEKVGGIGSALYSIPELGAGLLNLADRSFFGGYQPDFPERGLVHTVNEYVSEFPESEDEYARRIRTGVPAVITGAAQGAMVGGPAGALVGGTAALIGSQAGQSVRETFGEEGKFKEFGWGEGAALGTDFLFSLGINAVNQAARNPVAVSKVPAPFTQPNSRLQNAVVKQAMEGDRNKLQQVVNDFSKSQVSEFENQINQISPRKFSELPGSASSRANEYKAAQDTLYRNGQLAVISPIETSPENAGRAIQNAANETFRVNVTDAERQAYEAASQASRRLTGQAPRTLDEARALREDILRTPPSPEQSSMLSYLNDLIESLEEVVPAQEIPASTILDAYGNPVSPSRSIPESTALRTRNANDLIKLIQTGNQAANYDSVIREQSHRLIPILRTLREETGEILSRDPIASQLYENANDLHANNAQIWGTRYMRNVRFSENPENIISQTKKASNMRNFKQAVVDPTTQGLMERQVVEDATKSGSVESNNKFLRDMGDNLSPRAQGATREMINIKDPLTTQGGQAAARNGILSETAESIATGKRPDKVLTLMETPKGYNLVAQTLNYSPEARDIFRTFQRQFVEDLFDSVKDKTGKIDFKKAQNIIKEPQTRTVLRNIGGDPLVERIENLQRFSENFERNSDLYKTAQVQSIFKEVLQSGRNAGVLGYMLHTLHIQPEIMVSLGLGGALYKSSQIIGKGIINKFLSSPRAVALVESLSNATTPEQVAQILPRLVIEFDRLEQTPRKNKQNQKQKSQ